MYDSNLEKPKLRTRNPPTSRRTKRRAITVRATTGVAATRPPEELYKSRTSIFTETHQSIIISTRSVIGMMVAFAMEAFVVAQDDHAAAF